MKTMAEHKSDGKKDDKSSGAVSAEVKGMGAIAILILLFGGLYFLKLIGDGKINTQQQDNYLTRPRSSVPQAPGVELLSPDQYSQ